MATKLSVEEIEPFCKWVTEEEQEVLQLHLQGFKKEQLSVKINNLGELTISGERDLDDDHKRLRFRKQINVSKDCKKNAIHAKFSGGILYLTMPKRIPPLLPTHTQEHSHGKGNAKQSNNGDDRSGGTSGTTVSRLSKASANKLMSGLPCPVSLRPQMGGKTALKLGALAAVMLVAALVAFLLYKYRRAFHHDG